MQKEFNMAQEELKNRTPPEEIHIAEMKVKLLKVLLNMLTTILKS